MGVQLTALLCCIARTSILMNSASFSSSCKRGDVDAVCPSGSGGDASSDITFAANGADPSLSNSWSRRTAANASTCSFPKTFPIQSRSIVLEIGQQIENTPRGVQRWAYDRQDLRTSGLSPISFYAHAYANSKHRRKHLNVHAATSFIGR